MTFLEEKSKELKKVSIVVEIGSRWGCDSIKLKELFPDAKIYSFECTPSSIEIWKRNVKNEDNILIEKAVTDFTGETEFYINDMSRTITNRQLHPDGNQGANSLYHSSNLYGQEIYIQHQIKVPCTTIQDWANKNNIKKIDVLWIDAQGATFPILQGMGEILKTVRVVHAEVEFYEMYWGEVLFPDIYKFMEGKGFIFVGFENKDTIWADANWEREKDYYLKKRR